MLFNFVYKCTVVAEIKDIFLERCTVTENLNSVCEISVIPEIVALTVDFINSYISGIACHIITRTVIIACAFIICVPCAIGHTSLIKQVCNAVYSILSCYGSFGV